MNPTLLKTLAAASLVVSANAQVHVLGAVWKERGTDASSGVVSTGFDISLTTRAYLILDPSVITEENQPLTKIEYIQLRQQGVLTRTYTIDTEFTALHGDLVFGQSGGARYYGNIYAPVAVADVTDPTVPFLGNGLSSGFPSKLVFDRTTFVTGSSDAFAGPRLVIPNSDSTARRSQISGSAAPVKVNATTPAGAATELIERLVRSGYSRGPVAPRIVTNLPATLVRPGYVTADLSIALNGGAYPAPVFQWYKLDGSGNPVEVEGATGATFVVPAGDPGNGIFFAEASNDAGTVTSGRVEITTTPVALAFSTDVPATVQLTFNATRVLAPVVKADSYPRPTTYQWQKSIAVAGQYTNIAAGDGGTQPTFTVIGNNAATNGPGFYRLQINNGGTTPVTSAVANVTVIP